MRESIGYQEAIDILLGAVTPVEEEQLPLEQCAGRVLAQDITAAFSVPEFDRSPYDGYALRSLDTCLADKEHPVTLKILEEIPAGDVSHVPVGEKTAVKILTGAPIPPGADAVVMFEKTSFTREEVTIYGRLKPGENVVRAGEDVVAGTLLAKAGSLLDPGLLGTAAAQNITHLKVYQSPLVGIISTGSELLDPGMERSPGKIYNSNRYTLAAALKQSGCQPCYLGRVRDDVTAIADLIREGLTRCDALVLSGGVSVGDYDCTGGAMQQVGAELLVQGVGMKPGMACMYGVAGGKLICGLSGNPASALTNYCVVAQPAIRRLCGRKDPRHMPVKLTLAEGFPKASPAARFLRGKLEFTQGQARLHLSPDQGNVVLSSAIGVDAFAIIPAGSGPVAPGQVLDGILAS